MNYAEYELRIGDYVDGALDPSAQRALEAHLDACGRCRRVVEDCRAIRAASLTLESHAPQPHVWTRIAAAIDADRQRPRWWTMAPGLAWRPLAAAAIVLAVAAGTSWMVWRQLPPAPAVPPAATVNPDPDPELMPSMETELKLAEDHYVTAIAGLEEIAKTAGSDLDPETADVVQANLTVIDRAIGESRAALLAEPGSDLAQESLFEALRSKVALLQDTVALINEMRKGNEEGAARIVSGLNP